MIDYKQHHSTARTATIIKNNNLTKQQQVSEIMIRILSLFFFQAEDGIRDDLVTGVQTCALPIFTVNLALVTNGAPMIPSSGAPFVTRARLTVNSSRPATNSLVPSSGSIRKKLPRRSEERRVGKEGRSRWSPYH